MKQLYLFFCLLLFFCLFFQGSQYLDQHIVSKRIDKDGRLIVNIKGFGEVKTDKNGVAYNGCHKPVFKRHPKTGQETLFIYNKNQDILLEKVTEKGSSFFERNNAKLITKIIYPDKSVQSFEYNDQQKITKIVYPDGKQKLFTYDDIGRCIQKEKNGEIVQYEYTEDRLDPIKEIKPGGEIVEYYNGEATGPTQVNTKLLYNNVNDKKYYHNHVIETKIFCDKDYEKLDLCVNDDRYHGTPHRFGHGYCMWKDVIVGNYNKGEEYSAGVRKGFDAKHFYPDHTEVLHNIVVKDAISQIAEYVDSHHSYHFQKDNCIHLMYGVADIAGLDIEPPEKQNNKNFKKDKLLYPAKSHVYFAYKSGKISEEKYKEEYAKRSPWNDLWKRIGGYKEEEQEYNYKEYLQAYNESLFSEVLYDNTSLAELYLASQPLNADYRADPEFVLPHRMGGVCLSKKADVFINIGEITGAFYDESLGQLILCGKRNYTIPTMDFDDFAVAVQSIYGLKTKKEDPGVSIDPVNNTRHVVTYFGNTKDTHFGKILFEADLLMKKLAVGLNDVNIPGYRSIPDRAKDLNIYLDKYDCRVWFVPEKISLNTSLNDLAMVFDEVKIQILSEATLQNSPIHCRPVEDFVKQITNNFDRYVVRYPLFQKLIALSKITAIVKWLYDNHIHFDESFFRNYQPKKEPTVDAITPIRRELPWPRYHIVKREKIGWSWKHKKIKKRSYKEKVKDKNDILKVSGGILLQLNKENFLQNRHNFIDLLKKEALQQRPNDDTCSWNFLPSVAHEEYYLEAYNIQNCAKLGAVKMKFEDYASGGIVFSRYYNSFSDDDYGFGRGWDYLPKRLKYYEEPKEFLVDNKKEGPLYEYIYLTEGSKERQFAFVGYNTEKKKAFYQSSFHDCYLEYDLVRNRYKFYGKKSLDIFDGQGNLLRENRKDQVVTYSYKNNKLIKIHSSLTDKSLILEYKDGKIQKLKDTDLVYQYDTSGNLSTSISKEKTRQYTYDKSHRLTQITDGKSELFAAKYDLYNRAVYLCKNNEKIYKKYDSLNKEYITTFEDGKKIIQKYDEQYRLLQWTNGQDVINYHYEEDDENLTVTITDQTIQNSLQMKYDKEGKLLRYKDADKEEEYAYNPLGNIMNYRVTKNAKSEHYVFLYNKENLLAEVYRNPKIFIHTVNNIRVSGDDYLKYEYENTHLKRIIDPYGVIVEYELDAAGQIISCTHR